MQSNENIAWKRDGALHAQVESHWPVPRVTPAAIKAPILYPKLNRGSGSSYSEYSLVEVIKEAHAPRPPATRKRLGQIYPS